MASVAAATASIVGNIGAIGMAHEGIDSIPQTGTWLLEKGERVTTAETSAKMDRVLEDIRAGQREGFGRPVRRSSSVQQTIQVTGTIDPHTVNQLARASARKQRQVDARLGR
jgi:ketol-acid reductoisomerase